ncbi:hypothetical protein [Exiguobacterium sp. BG5(2022)]|uniref:hypothetical protein n=1 Tax=Exiguobacterium sp. BG5(2022) TaxID=2962595 RepID=UPI002880CB9C|nr:hypothetical protein [Exiguobacterium sp. BG5(2022)]MDT0192384.1 hypothetical protein [Exiguobacterium sp. BG5(2022)]
MGKLWNRAVGSYILIFILWIILGVLINNLYLNNQETVATLVGWTSINFQMTTDQISISLFILTICYLFLSRIFVRVDGFLYLSSKFGGIISDDLFLFRYRKLIHLFFVFMGAFILLFTIHPGFIVRTAASIIAFIYLWMSIRILETKDVNPSVVKLTRNFSIRVKVFYQFIFIYIAIINLLITLRFESSFFNTVGWSWFLLILFTPVFIVYTFYKLNLVLYAIHSLDFFGRFGWFSLNSPSYWMEGIFITMIFIPFIYVILFVIVYSFTFVRRQWRKKNQINLKTLCNQGRKLKSLFFNLMFMEYKAADQSKKHTENLAILNKIYEESNGNITYEGSKLENLILSTHGQMFLKDINEGPDFLELKRKKDYITFLQNVRGASKGFEEFSLEEKNLLESFSKDHKFYSRPSMEARTKNIIMRNNNNLLISVYLLLFTIIILSLIKLEMAFFDFRYLSKSKDIIFGLIVVGSFIRLTYRSSEICRAFYFDLIDRKLPQSFLNGKNRIMLAMKSLVEIILLCAAIYLSYETFRGSLTFFTTIKTIGYSLTTSLFNVSYPGLLIGTEGVKDVWKGNVYDVILLLTHIIQIITSFVLITMSIAGYLNFPKVPVYYDFYSDNKKFKIVKKTFDHQLERKVITIKKVMHNDVLSEWDFLEKKIMHAYRSKSISEEDANYSLELIRYQKDYSGE